MIPTFLPPLEGIVQRLGQHPVYGSLRTPHDLRIFLEHHVVCVLDFMSLLKRLQGELTCIQSPWVPPRDPVSARLVNEMVLDEESDASFGPEPSSHYDWYVAAMEELGANTRPIRELENRLACGMDPVAAIPGCGFSEAAEDFANTTFTLVRGPLHVVAAAFVLGRENVIPKMFLPLVRGLRESGLSCSLFVRYLERHVEIDSESHGPSALAMLSRIVSQQDRGWSEAQDAARRSLEAREKLWNAVLASISARRPAPMTS